MSVGGVNGPSGVSGVYTKKGVSKVNKTNKVQSKKDVAAISKTGKDFATVLEHVGPDIREEKVKPLRELVKNDKYEVSGKDILERMTQRYNKRV